MLTRLTGTEVTVNFLAALKGSSALVILDGVPIQEVQLNNTLSKYYQCSVVPVSSGTLPQAEHNVTVIKDVVPNLMFVQNFV